jgi:hypothetical protein
MTQRTYDPRTYDPRFDHRPTLLLWALATAVCVLVLAVAMFVTVHPAAPPSTTNANPGAAAAPAQSGGGVGSGAGAYFGNDSLKEQQVPPVLAAPKEMDDSAIERHAKPVLEYGR